MERNAPSKLGYPFDRNNVNHWWFGDCPKNETFWCWSYEFKRDCAAARALFDEWQKKFKPIKLSAGSEEWFQYLIELWQSELESMRYPELYVQIWFKKWWPRVPYLDIPADERCETLATMRKIRQPELENLRKKIEARAPAAFPITDWKKSDSRLHDEFERWLKKNRPKNLKADETRGGASWDRKTLVSLKELGAYRLTSEMSASQAIEHAKDLGLQDWYKNQPAVSKARNRALKTLEWLNSTYTLQKG